MEQKTEMQRLNLPYYEFRFNSKGEKTYIFDVVRKRFVLLTPEEWVRQNFMQYLISEKNYPQSLMAVEKQISLNGKLFRFDLVVYRKNGQPLLVAEFKAPDVKISQETFNQVVRYNMSLKVKHVLVSNGLQHFVCEIDYEKNSYKYLQEVPAF
jgi:type I site-specific restriction-modification system R (restriction) subunit